MYERTTPRSLPRPDLLTRLRRAKHRTKLLDHIVDEILQLKAAAASAQQAADRWQARAEQAERELGRLRARGGYPENAGKRVRQHVRKVRAAA